MKFREGSTRIDRCVRMSEQVSYKCLRWLDSEMLDIKGNKDTHATIYELFATKVHNHQPYPKKDVG